MKCNFEHWPLLTRSLYGYGKEINITPFQLLSQLSDSRYMQMCSTLSPLVFPTDEWEKKENKASVSHQLPLKAPLGNEFGNYLFPLREYSLRWLLCSLYQALYSCLICFHTSLAHLK